MAFNLEEICENLSKKKYEVPRRYPSQTPYPPDYVFDEGQSVKWNREQVIIENDKITAAKKAYRDAENAAYKAFSTDVIDFIQDTYNLNETQAAYIFGKAYEDSHSEGYNAVLYKASDYGTFARTILDAIAPPSNDPLTLEALGVAAAVLIESAHQTTLDGTYVSIEWFNKVKAELDALKAKQAAKLDRSRWDGCDVCTPKEMFCNWKRANYCPFCGRPLTEEAWAELERRIGGNDGTTD